MIGYIDIAGTRLIGDDSICEREETFCDIDIVIETHVSAHFMMGMKHAFIATCLNSLTASSLQISKHHHHACMQT